MLRFPSQIRAGEGVLTQVLGPRGTPGVDTKSIIHEFGLREEFPEQVLEEAREQAEEFDESRLGHRLDLTGETIVTIDPFDARDFDDAISLSQAENGSWRLGVHIADVSHFVPAGNARWTLRHASAAQAFICPIACCPCCRRSFPTDWPACNGEKSASRSRSSSISRRRGFRSTPILPGRPFASHGDSPTRTCWP